MVSTSQPKVHQCINRVNESGVLFVIYLMYTKILVFRIGTIILPVRESFRLQVPILHFSNYRVCRGHLKITLCCKGIIDMVFN